MKKGLTLLEVLVTSLLMAIVFTGIAMILSFSFDLSGDIYSQSKANSDMFLLRSLLMQDVREASKVAVPSDGLSLVVKKSIAGVLTDVSKYDIFYDTGLLKYKLRRSVKSGSTWSNWQVLTNQSEVIIIAGEKPFDPTGPDGEIVLSANLKTKVNREPKAFSAILKTYIACRNI